MEREYWGGGGCFVILRDTNYCLGDKRESCVTGICTRRVRGEKHVQSSGLNDGRKEEIWQT
jgi:hypothetical protein